MNHRFFSFFPEILNLITWVMKKHPWAFLNNKKYYKNYRLLQHFEMSKILLDTLRTKTNYKYAIHFWNTLSLNVLLCAISFLFEGGKALINPAQWIIHCSITKVTYTITLYIGKCLCFFFKAGQTALSRILKFLLWKRKAIRTQFGLALENCAFVFQSHRR